MRQLFHSNDDLQDEQTAIYRVALSLDAFLLNGIPYGVIPREDFHGFLEKTAGNLLTALAHLDEQASHTPAANQVKVTGVLGQLRAKLQQVIDSVTGLISFRTFSREHLRSTVSQIPLLYRECVQQIQDLETCLAIPKPFYQSRPAHSATAMTDFFANLENLFTQHRN